MESSAAAAIPRVYRLRRPERKVLYGAFALNFEDFVEVYEERFLRTHGYLRGCVEPAVYRYLDCGIFDHGVARVRCSDCRHEFLIAFSCKLRGLCPSCHQKREILWAEWTGKELLEDAGVSAGAVGFGQTAGELINFHPHVQVLVTDGGFLPDRTFRLLAWFNSQHVERLFCAEVLPRRSARASSCRPRSLSLEAPGSAPRARDRCDC